jgi:transposase
VVPRLRPSGASADAAAGRCRNPRQPACAQGHRRGETIEATGARLLFLPPYSPDFNPIENAFAKLKTLLRKAAARTIDDLWHVIGQCLDAFTPDECVNYFANCGYDAD